MKLKKIASLALAGVMAVSMLAGCGDNSNNSSSTPTGDVEVTSTPAIVEAMNKYQDVTQKVQINFTAASSSLTDKVVAAVDEMGNMQGTTANAAAVISSLQKSIGTTYVFGNSRATTLANAAFLNNVKSADAAKHDGEKHTAYFVFGYTGANYNSLEMAAYTALTATNGVQDFIDKLETKNPDPVAPDADYLTYAYTGSVSSVTAALSTGAPVYYIVVEITQTATLKTA